ncbi:MAG TPA: septal ring lytic transglycosylase RlpA family protein [Acidocella sp.]|nr:septal ring lytic transglycosylase RlpA family protein [Acidocella sp.]
MELTAPMPCRMAAKSRLRLVPALAMSLLMGFLSACAAPPAPAPQASLVPPPAPPPPRAPELVVNGPEILGTASWYKSGPGRHHTCTGETFTSHELTAASHSIPVGTQVRVALLDDDSRSIIVRVNDCMPRGHRILDLSEGAAEELGVVNLGVARVSVTPVVLVDNR